jgi:hypothetical protein
VTGEERGNRGNRGSRGSEHTVETRVTTCEEVTNLLESSLSSKRREKAVPSLPSRTPNSEYNTRENNNHKVR